MPQVTGKAALVRGDHRALLERILDTPQLAQAVPRLPPDVIHLVIDRCGLEDCGALMALATPAQVAQVLDLDLWRSADAGLDQQFDAERFGVWLEVLVEQGVDVAARAVASLDVDLVAAGLMQHVRIFDIATLDAYVTSDGTDIPAVIERDGGLGCDIAGRRLIPRRPDAWDAVVAVLSELDASHHRAFVRLMAACTALSNSRREVDGLDALLSGAQQAMFELADGREQRREARGFASAAQARGFLESSRRLRLDAGAPPPAGPFAASQASAAAEAPIVEPAREPDRDPSMADPTAAVVDLLLEAGLLTPSPRALLAAAPGQPSRLARIHAQMEAVLRRDPAAYSTRQQELAWLGNALIAGGTVDARAFTAAEASDAVIATCNLGLESWPARWRGGVPMADDFLVEHDLVSVFQVGWTVLHDDVCAHAASTLIDVLAVLPRHDPDTQADLDALRAVLTRHVRAGTAWQARDALDVLASLDLPAWATLLGLIAECPVALATIDPRQAVRPRTIDPSAFAFISERAQVDAVAAFLATLPELLGG